MLRFWNSRMLPLEGRIIIFKTLGISKIVYLAFLTVIPNALDKNFKKCGKCLYGTPQAQKLVTKHYVTTENSELKHVRISSKIISLQCSWLRKFFDENFHEWKIIPSYQ